MIEYWTQAENFFITLWTENVSLVSSVFTRVWDGSKLLLDVLQGKIEQIEKKIMAVGLFRKLVQTYKNYATWIDELPIQEFTKKIEALMNIRLISKKK